MNKLQSLFRSIHEPYTIPRSVQDLIPIQKIWDNGITQYETHFSKVFRFTDVNYQVLSQEAQKVIFLAYAALLKSLDPNINVSINIHNHYMNQTAFQETLLCPMRQDGLNYIRREINDYLLNQSAISNNILQERYITVSIQKETIEEANTYFIRIANELEMRFSDFGSACSELNATERLRVLHNFYRPGEESMFHLDLHKMMRYGHDFKDYICPDSMEKHSDYLRIGNKYARVLFLKDYASGLRDDIVTRLTELNQNLMFSFNFSPMSNEEAIRLVTRKLLMVNTNLAAWQRRQNNNLNFSASTPYHLEEQLQELKDLMKDLSARDQRLLTGCISIVHMADTKEQLDSDSETLCSIVRVHGCQLAVMKYRQLDGLRTTLPFGIQNIATLRTLTTESAATFMPLNVQEIHEPGGIFFGLNAASKNMILCNMDNLLNQSMFVLGIPGSGKSFFVKLLILLLYFYTNDDIIICDPEGEFTPLVELLHGSVTRIEAGGRDRLNAMDLFDGYGDTDPLVEKAQYIMTLFELMKNEPLSSQQKSILDRCVIEIYRTTSNPSLPLLREMLMAQAEEEAQKLALDLELFSSGSLNIFAQKTNVNLENRLTSFDTHNLSGQMKPTGILTISDVMRNRVAQNWKNGRKTHIFIDEFHVIYENDYGRIFFDSAWRQMRKRNACPCAITQNITTLLRDPNTSSMISNSECIVMFNQAAQDRELLAQLLNISPEQSAHYSDTEAGHGLLRYGKSIIPFINKFPSDTEIYKYITTKPGEGVFAKGQVY